MVIKILNEFRGRIDELSESVNKDIGNIKTEIENMKKNQSDMKDTLTEVKINL